VYRIFKKKGGIKMTSALEVSRFLIFLKDHDPRGLELSNLKLQKLLYYSQGYYLSMYGEPMFEDSIEAWKYGPVVPGVYRSFKSFGHLDIKTPNAEHYDYTALENRKQSVIAYVWKTLGEMTAGSLVDKTHSELPWLRTWLNDGDKIISNDLLEAFFNRNVSDNIPIYS
jgi:uncharacterized phage-associated protein